VANKERRAEFRAMLRIAGENWSLFASIGVCESIAYTLQPLSVPRLPKALVPVLSQVLLPMSMLLNTWLLRKRYSALQYFGVGVMILGIAIATSSEVSPEEETEWKSPSTTIAPMLMLVMSYVFLGFSVVFKEVAFIRATSVGVRMDIFVLDGASALGQYMALLLQWPMNFALLTDLAPRAYFSAAYAAFTDSTKLMPGLLLVYWACNVLYRLGMLRSVQRLSSLTTLFSNMFTVPLSSLVFCLPLQLPLLGRSEQFSLALVLGLLVLCMGLLIFHFAVLNSGLFSLLRSLHRPRPEAEAKDEEPSAAGPSGENQDSARD